MDQLASVGRVDVESLKEMRDLKVDRLGERCGSWEEGVEESILSRNIIDVWYENVPLIIS